MCANLRRDDPSGESSFALLDLPARDHRKTSEDNLDAVSTSRASPAGSHKSRVDSPRPPSILGKAAKPTLVARLGWWILLTDIGSLILLLGALSALSFLWFGSHSNSNWRRVVINGWIGQAVTLSTLAIRLAVATQASTAVAMIAAVSFEKGGVLLAEAPAISIARYVNTGPLTTFLPFWNNATWPRCGLILPMILLLAVCTFVSQFTSTLLLWDVRGSTVQGFSHPDRGTSGMGMEYYIDRFQSTVEMGQNYWISSPQTFPTFAEWRAKPISLDSVADTGPTIRAFLPVNSQLDRSLLNKFEGTAAAFDTRVICARPVFTDWAFVPGNISNDDDTRGYFTGHARPTELTADMKLLLRQNKLDVSFRCMFDDLDMLVDPMFKACFVGSGAGGLINGLDQTSNSSMGHYFNNQTVRNDHYAYTNMAWMAPDKDSKVQWPVEMGHTFLLFRSRGNTTDILESSWSDNSMNFSSTDRGVWVDFSSPSNLSLPFPSNVTAEVSVTMCYDAWYNNNLTHPRIKHMQEFPISANRSTNISEPSLGWNTKDNSFDTTAVRIQLGATKNPDQETARSILQLNMDALENVRRGYSAQWSPNFNFSFNDVRLSRTLWYLNSTVDVPGILDFYSSFNNSKLFGDNAYRTNETYDFLNSAIWWPFKSSSGANLDHYEMYAPCATCTLHRAIALAGNYPRNVTHQVLNPILNAIFRDTLIETDNPALAWQALMTTILRMAYYDWLPTFDNSAEMKTVSTVPCQMPIYYRGFIIVVVNLAVHLGLVVTAFVWFAKVTRVSLLNNSWQVVAQLKAPATDKILDSATMADDGAVKRQIGGQGELRRRFKVTGGEQSDRVHLS